MRIGLLVQVLFFLFVRTINNCVVLLELLLVLLKVLVKMMNTRLRWMVVRSPRGLALR